LRRPAASKLGGGGGNGGKGLGFGEQGAPSYKGEEGREGLGGHAGRASGRWRGAAAPAAQPGASRHRGGEDGG
jgi:hypothetical protein